MTDTDIVTDQDIIYEYQSFHGMRSVTFNMKTGYTQVGLLFTVDGGRGEDYIFTVVEASR